MNIDNYLGRISEHEKTVQNDLLKRQISDYKDFIKQLVELGDIMQKRFYVVIPLKPGEEAAGTEMDTGKGFFKRLTEILSPTIAGKISDKKFEKLKFDLSLRVNQIIGGLSSMSLNAVQLDTQSLIELYYTVYNPELFETQRLTDISDLQIEG
jgi:hypothetical protein